jgi:hypothetical protein
MGPKENGQRKGLDPSQWEDIDKNGQRNGPCRGKGDKWSSEREQTFLVIHCCYQGEVV